MMLITSMLFVIGGFFKIFISGEPTNGLVCFAIAAVCYVADDVGKIVKKLEEEE